MEEGEGEGEGDGEEAAEESAKKRRGKSQEKRSEDALKNYSTVSAKLNSFMRSGAEPFRDAIRNTMEEDVITMSKIANEGYMFATFYLLYVKELGVPWPDIDQGFFTSCSRIVTASKQECGKKYIFFQDAFQEYSECRPDEWGYTVPRNEYMDKLIEAQARQMATNFDNYIKSTFLKRLVDHVHFVYGVDGSKGQRRKFVYEAWTGKFDTDEDEEGKHEGFAEWLEECSPWDEKQMEKRSNRYLVKLLDMIRSMEALPHDEKGRKTFSLLPGKSDFQISHMRMTKACLLNILQKLDVKHQVELLKKVEERLKEKGKVAEAKIVEGYLKEKKDQKKGNILTDSFWKRDEEIVNQIWREVFQVEKFETERRKFAYVMSTNGYDVTVTLQVPKTEAELKKEREEKEEKSKKRSRKTDQEVKDEEDKEYDAFPASCDGFETFIGIDPGRTKVISAYSGNMTPDGKKSSCLMISQREYYSRIHQNDFNKYQERLRKRDINYNTILRFMPTMKTGSFDAFKEAVRYRLRYQDMLFDYYAADEGFRRNRFRSKIYKQKALDEICRTIVKEESKQARKKEKRKNRKARKKRKKKGEKEPAERKKQRDLTKKNMIGFGDWSAKQDTGFFKGKSTMTAPVKKIRRELRRYATVVRIHEFNTSQVCSTCHEKMENMVERQIVHDETGCHFPSRKVHQVVCCKSMGCTKQWQRDVNASRNMYDLLMCKVKGEPRPERFKPPPKKEEEGPQHQQKKRRRTTIAGSDKLSREG